MKKILTMMAVFFSLVSFGQYSGTYGISDNGPVPGGFLYWIYTLDGGLNYQAENIMEFGDAYFKLRPARAVVPSVNTNTRLLGTNALGEISPYDISALTSEKLYANTNTVAGGAGNVVFYLTSDKTATGTALYTSMPYVNPIVNNSTTNFTYQWTISPDFKTLTVNVKSSPGLVVGLLTLLGVPVNVANGTSVNVFTKQFN